MAIKIIKGSNELTNEVRFETVDVNNNGDMHNVYYNDLQKTLKNITESDLKDSIIIYDCDKHTFILSPNNSLSDNEVKNTYNYIPYIRSIDENDVEEYYKEDFSRNICGLNIYDHANGEDISKYFKYGNNRKHGSEYVYNRKTPFKALYDKFDCIIKNDEKTLNTIKNEPKYTSLSGLGQNIKLSEININNLPSKKINYDNDGYSYWSM